MCFHQFVLPFFHKFEFIFQEFESDFSTIYVRYFLNELILFFQEIEGICIFSFSERISCLLESSHLENPYVLVGC